MAQKYTDAEIRSAAIEVYISSHPGASRQEAEAQVDRMLPTMLREEAIQLYIEKRAPEEVNVDQRVQTEDSLWAWEQTAGEEDAPAAAPSEQLAQAGDKSEVEQFEARFDIDLPDPNDPKSMLVQALRAAGADLDDPQLQLVLQNIPSVVLENEAMQGALIASLAADYPAGVVTTYEQALQAAGFTDPFPRPELPDISERSRAALEQHASMAAELKLPRKNYETQEESGWIRYQNGVLVNPDGGPNVAGTVIYDPTSSAPGSQNWMRAVSGWSSEKIASWKAKLHQYGYLSKEDLKLEGADVNFLNALQAFQDNRYWNGGQALTQDLAAARGAGGDGSELPPLVDFKDMGAQIRNDVREQYERVYGVRPTDGQVASWASYIMNTGMALQRKFRSKYDTPMTEAAATEAEERFIERLEGSPDATFLRENTEENTKLHDALSRAIQVTGSLA